MLLWSWQRSCVRGSWRGITLGSVVALGADGEVDWSVGSVDEPILARSCNKPIQALGMVRLGLDLPDELLALVCASRSGRPSTSTAYAGSLPGPGWTSQRCRLLWTIRSTTRPARPRFAPGETGTDLDELLGQARRDAPPA